VLLVIDTRSNLGESVEMDGRRMESLLRTGIPPNRLELTVFNKAGQLTRNSILNYYRNLKTGPSEALLFYYAGHGATDPDKGHFFALQELDTEPLIRDELRREMLQKKTGLVVILTDCCSNRYPLKKKRKVWDTDHKEINPVLHNLFFQSKGVVDITASTGTVAFGDEHEGGIFTQTFYKLAVLGRAADLDVNHDGFVDWNEFFGRLQRDTERRFVSWAAKQRALGEQIEEKSQKPRALQLPGQGTASTAGVTIRNDTNRTIEYEYRWNKNDAWKKGTVTAKKSTVHELPAKQEAASARLEIRSKEGNGTAKPGTTLRFHD
jgi:hypothetical protein